MTMIGNAMNTTGDTNAEAISSDGPVRSTGRIVSHQAHGAASLCAVAAIALLALALTACSRPVPAGSGGMADSAASSAPKMAPPPAAGSAPSAP